MKSMNIIPLTSVIFSSLLFINDEIMANPCNYNEEKAPTSLQIKFEILGNKLETLAEVYSSINANENDNTGIVNYRISINIDPLKQLLPQYMKAKIQIPVSNETDRYSASDYYLRGTGENLLLGGFTIHFEKVIFIAQIGNEGATIPCPEVDFLNGKSDMNKRCPLLYKPAQTIPTGIKADANILVQIKAKAKNGDIEIETNSSGNGSFTGTLAPILTTLSGFDFNLNSTLFSSGLNELLKPQLNKFVDDFVRLRSSKSETQTLPDPVPVGIAKYVKTDLTSAEFRGENPIKLELYYSVLGKDGNPLGIHTACDIKDRIISNK